MSTVSYSEQDPLMAEWQFASPDYVWEPGVRPQLRYAVTCPLILSATAVLIWVVPTDLMTAICCGIGSLVGLVLLWTFAFTDQSIRLTRVAAMGLVLGYAGGALNSWLTYARAGAPLASVVGITVGELARGLGATLLGSAVLLSAGEWLEKPVWTTSRRFTFSPALKRILLVSLAIAAFALATGEIVQEGIDTSSGHAGIFGLLVLFVLRPAVILITVAFMVEENRKDRILFGFATGLIWLIEFTQGRREMVYPAVIIIAVARYAGYRWSKITFQRVVMICVSAVLLFLGVLGFQLMRYAGRQIGNPKLSQEAPAALDLALSGRGWQIATQSSAKNVKGRTLVLAWFSDLYDLSAQYPTAHGFDLMSQLEEVIPTALYPSKAPIGEEALASEIFGRMYPDEANSLFTCGVIDFGLIGVLIYPILVILFVSVCLRYIRWIFPVEAYIYSVVAMLVVAISAETVVTGYALQLRNTYIFGVGLYLLSKLPVLRRKSDVEGRLV